MEKITIFFTRPSYDLPTGVLFYFSGSLIKDIEEIGEFKLIQLLDDEVTRDNFEKILKKEETRLIVLNGHGSKDKVFGHKEVILDKENIHLLNSKIIYAVVCDSAEELGKFSNEEGKAESFIGYRANFMIVVDPTRVSTPSKDKNIRPFEKAYATTVLSLISGLTVKESVVETKNILKQLIREYGVYAIRDKFGDAPLIRFALYWDYHFLTFYGKGEATVFN